MTSRSYKLVSVGSLCFLLLAGFSEVQANLLSEEECYAIVQRLTSNLYGIRPQNWDVHRQIRSLDALYRFESPEIHITVNGRGTSNCRAGYIVGIGLGSLLDTMDSKGYISEEQALIVAKEYISEVVGYVPEGRLVPRSLGPDIFPHWRIVLDRYTSGGIFVDTLVIVTIHEGNVISYVCRDFPDSDVSDLSVIPQLSLQEAKKIAKRELSSPLRQAFDEPVNVELGFIHPAQIVEREGWHGIELARERVLDTRILVWRVLFDDTEVVVDANYGEVLRKEFALTPHGWGRETLCVAAIIICLAIGGMGLREVVRRRHRGAHALIQGC